MAVKGILFDMDGLLFDTEKVACEADRLACRELGFELRDDVLVQLYGSNKKSAKAIFHKYYGPAFDYERFRKLMRGHVTRITEEKGGLRPMPGAAELLFYLSQQPYKLAVASSSACAIIQRFLNMSGFAHYFSAIVGGDLVEDAKPSPDIFLLAAKELGFAPSDCLALEDSPNGIQSAAAAGCITVMVPDTILPTDEMRALCFDVVDSLYDIPALLQRLA